MRLHKIAKQFVLKRVELHKSLLERIANFFNPLFEYSTDVLNNVSDFNDSDDCSATKT